MTDIIEYIAYVDKIEPLDTQVLLDTEDGGFDLHFIETKRLAEKGITERGQCFSLTLTFLDESRQRGELGNFELITEPSPEMEEKIRQALEIRVPEILPK